MKILSLSRFFVEELRVSVFIPINVTLISNLLDGAIILKFPSKSDVVPETNLSF